MLDSKCRKSYDKWILSPIVKHTQFHPMVITAIASITGIAVCASVIAQRPLTAVFFLLISGFLDTLDGALARKQNLSSPLGAVCDIVADRFVEFSIIFGLYFLDPARSTLIILMLGSILLCITSFLVVGIFSQNRSEKSFHYSAGLIERTEAFLFFGAMILFPALFTPLAVAFVVLVLWTTMARLFAFSQKSC